MLISHIITARLEAEPFVVCIRVRKMLRVLSKIRRVGPIKIIIKEQPKNPLQARRFIQKFIEPNEAACN